VLLLPGRPDDVPAVVGSARAGYRRLMSGASHDPILPQIMLCAPAKARSSGSVPSAVGSARPRISPTIAVKEWLLAGLPEPLGAACAGTSQIATRRHPPASMTNPRGARRDVPAIIDKVLRAGEGKILRKLHRITEQVNSIETDYEA